MKKILGIILVVAFVVTQLAVFTACNDITEEQFTMPEMNYETYNNGDFCDYTGTGEQSNDFVPEQWPNYGIGDPYVFRFNGTYYLYCSSRDNWNGVRAWKSTDLVHWQQCTAKGFTEEQTGYVSIDESLVGAFAPEVYYWNGFFYMYSSPSGLGHYVYKADSPEGPFVRVTDKLDKRIDGSMFIDDDEKMYFLTAGEAGIIMSQAANMQDLYSGDTAFTRVNLSNTVIGSWTEGPMIIKRNGIYYITYTGTDVESQAYRISYSTETDGKKFGDDDAFTYGVDLPIVLTVDEQNNFKGLGHSSTVMGPDMDSYYIVYHSLNTLTTNGPYRSLNIDRLIFNGTQMSVDESKTNSIKAAQPNFYATEVSADKFDINGNTALSKQSVGKTFTAEFNLKGDNVKCVVSYVDADNYAYVIADYAAKTIKLVNVAGGKESVVATGTLVNDFDKNVIHTIRVAYADGKADVYFDNMCKISDSEVTLNGGKVGYVGDGEYYCTTFSDVAKGKSDKVEPKQSGASIGASNYLPSDYFEGVQSYDLTNSELSKVTVDKQYVDDIGYNGSYQLTFGKNGDFARYLVYFRQSGHYGLKLTYDQKYAGKKIGFKVNGGQLQTVTLPQVTCSETGCIISAFIGGFDVTAGANFVALYGVGDDVGFISFSCERIANNGYEFSNSLADVVEKGAIYSTMYRLYDGGHATRGGSIMLAYIGDDTLSDFEVSVKIKFVSHNAYSAGLIVRGRNFANARYDGATSIQGYYIGLDSRNVNISRFNHSKSQTKVEADAIGKTKDKLTKEFTTLKVVAEGNTISVYVDGEFKFEIHDAHAFLTGYVGLYSDGAEVVYKDFYIKQI